jgi:2-dehydropantoate 2-reductase
MNILIYGAGVIGSIYAARLQEAGCRITLLARGQRAVSLRMQGILLENALTGQRTATYVSVIENLVPNAIYDVVLVTVRMEQLASVLPVLAANHNIPTVLFMLNNPDGIKRYETLAPKRILLGFPSVGGMRHGEVVRYINIRQQQTTLGEIGGQVTPRLQQLAKAFGKAGFSVAFSHNIQAWLKTHAVFISCISAALAMTNGDSVLLGHTRKNVILLVKAIREGFIALRSQGIPISPFNLKVIFLWMPLWFAVLYWQYALRTTVGTLAIAPHAAAARDEMRQVANDIMVQIKISSVPTPNLNSLLTFLDTPPEQPCVSASSARL